MNNTVFIRGLRALGFSVVLALARAQAADLYVSTLGSDSSPGTSAQPFRTITYAYSKASAGTTLRVLPGVYYDYTSAWGIHLGKSGTASSPIVLHSETRGGAIIDGQNASDRADGFYIDGNYNTVDGFVIRNCPLGGMSIWANGNRILNNEIHHNGNPANSSSNGRDGVYSNEGTSGNYYAGNYIHDNGRSGSNLDHGLYLCGQNEVVINNVLFRNASSGLQIAGYTTVSNMKVYNNVMAWNGTQGIILWMSLNGVDIKNNIIYANSQDGVLSYGAHGSGVVFDHNLNYGNGSANYDFTAGGSDYSYTLGTTISADPRLVSDASASFDPHLGSGSPAIGAGMNLSSTTTTDQAGTARPASGAWDLGAYIYATGNTPPTISSIANQTVTVGSSTGPLPFTVSDAQTSANNLSVSGSSSQTTLVPNANIVFGGSGGSRTVTVTPTSGQTGTATITLTVSYGSLSASTSFTLTVNALPAPAVTMNTPINGASYTAPATITLGASVTANGHTITKVRFYEGTTLLAEDTATPYTFTYTNVSARTCGMSAMAVYDSGSTVSSPAVTVIITNTPPTISRIANQTINAGSLAGPLALTVNDAQTSAVNLTVSASSSQTKLVPNANIVFGGSGANRTVTVTPASGQTGATTITMAVSDGSLSSSTSFTLTVNALPAPVATLTAPANGASYGAPATVRLSANITANGHTITQVQFYNRSNLLGAATSAPYCFTWNSVGAGSYSLSAVAVYDAGSTVSSPAVTVAVTNVAPTSGLTFASTSGVISAPFYVTNNAIVQPAYTTLGAGGKAVYTFNVSATGNYMVSALVNAPSTSYNSVFVNVDAQPTDPLMIWDTAVTGGLVSQTVSWRGNGTDNGSGTGGQYTPKVFSLTAGTHQLIIRGREGMCQLGTITIAPTTLSAN